MPEIHYMHAYFSGTDKALSCKQMNKSVWFTGLKGWIEYDRMCTSGWEGGRRVIFRVEE